jgi:hypothetical protein
VRRLSGYKATQPRKKRPEIKRLIPNSLRIGTANLKSGTGNAKRRTGKRVSETVWMRFFYYGQGFAIRGKSPNLRSGLGVRFLSEGTGILNLMDKFAVDFLCCYGPRKWTTQSTPPDCGQLLRRHFWKHPRAPSSSRMARQAGYGSFSCLRAVMGTMERFC